MPFEFQPIILILSTSHHFIGVSTKSISSTKMQLRIDNANDNIELMHRKNKEWGSKQLLNLIEKNMETGRSEDYNISSLI